jgi:DNA (cytosine-5)-methyltransferase 1
MAWYNEIDPYCAQWLRNLISAGHIAPGDVDERDIRDVRADDVRGYTQCHFFAGIGGWSLALRIAGIPDSTPLWTGSPPCQNNSNAAAITGNRTGLRGERSGLAHTWLDLVGNVQPGSLYFENVPGITPWLAEIENRLEGFGYAPARFKRSTADIGGPNLRRRVWIAAHRDGQGLEKSGQQQSCTTFSDPRRTAPGNVWTPSADRACGMVDGFPARVAAVRAFGNAIDPWVAAQIIRESL